MRESFLSKFTPSLLKPDTLEAIFVKREPLARKLVDVIRESATTKNKHYALVVGPRGIGKTHLVSLVYHRVCKDSEAAERLVIAWLREEEWSVASFLDFLLTILRALREAHESAELAARHKALFRLTPEQAELEAEKLLRETVGDKTLLVIAENLDEIFRGLEETGQQKLRAYIQNNPFFTILATSQSLFNGVSVRTSPFYGFFETHHLQEFSFEDVVAMLAKIAETENDGELASMIRTARGRARVRAVHHLAAGNPRVYVIFSQFLTRESLDQLVEPLMQTLDDLTPYYQGRMSHLSPQQRKIVEFLCDRRGAVAVTKIAEKNFLTAQTASSQLKKLSELGYVRSDRNGRESYYELREPLMRISLEVKKLRGEPVRLLVQFLQLWYSRTELNKRLQSLEPDARAEREYLAEALRATEGESQDPVVAACLDDCRKYSKSQEFDRALEVADELVAIRGYPTDWVERATCLRKLDRDVEAEESESRALHYEPKDAAGWRDSARAFLRLDRYTEALQACERALEAEPGDAVAWRRRGSALEGLGRHDEALASVEKALALDPEDAVACHNRGVYLERLNRDDEALASVEKALALDPEDAVAWHNRGVYLERLSRYEEALPSVEKALELDPKHAPTWRFRGGLLGQLGRHDEALASIDKALELDPQNADAHGDRGVALSSLGRNEEALAAFDTALKLMSDEHRQEASRFQERSNRAVVLMLLGRWDEGLAALEDALERLDDVGGQDSDADVAIVRNMLIRTRDEATWRRFISVWVDLFDKHDLLPALGQGIVSSISRLSIPWITDEAARAWRDVWQELGGGHKELTLPLRLLNATVEYRAKPDKRILLSLPIEERKLLEPLLGIEKTTQTA